MRDFIKKHLSETSEIALSLEKQEAEISKIIDMLFEALINDKQIFIFGNGGSASTAIHFKCDLSKSTIIEGKRRFRVHCLNDNIPLVSALVNDEGWDNIYIEQLKNNLNRGDVVIAISVHGGTGRDKAGQWSQNLLKAVDYAKQNGGKAIGFSGFDGGALREIADACVTVRVNSTPHVESFHVVLHHMICEGLRRKIAGEA